MQSRAFIFTEFSWLSSFSTPLFLSKIEKFSSVDKVSNYRREEAKLADWAKLCSK
jgi:hypothetical protein